MLTVQLGVGFHKIVQINKTSWISVKMFGLMLGTGSLQACRVSSNMARWLSTSHPALTKIIYTETDEAPMLATYSLLPVIQRFAKPLGIEVSSEFGGISSTP